MSTAMDGVIIGGAGGAIAGITVYVVQYLHTRISLWRDSRIVHKWLKENTVDERGKRYRSTRAIASWCNFTEERVRQLCSNHKGVYLSTGQAEDMWSIYIRSSDDRDDEGPRISAL